MAFIEDNSNQFEEEDEKKKNQLITPQSTIIDSGLGSGGITSAGAPVSQPFATLQKYLSPNQPQAEQFASKVAGEVKSVADTARQDISEFGNKVTSDIAANKLESDTNLVDTVLGDPLKATQEQKDAFERQRTGTYSGPTDTTTLPDYSKASTSLSKANETRELLDTEGGRKQLVADQQKNKSAGITGLNQALVSSIPTARQELENTKGEFADLNDLMGGVAQDAATKIVAAQQKAQEANQYAGSKLSEKILQFNESLKNKTAEARSTLTAVAQSATEKLANGQPLTAEEMKVLNVSSADIDQIRKQQSTLKQDYGQDFEISPYATMQSADTVIQPSNLAGAEDYELEAALEQLLGEELPFLTESTRSQAGTAPTSLVDFRGSDAKADVNAQLSALDNQFIDNLTADQRNSVDSTSGGFDWRNIDPAYINTAQTGGRHRIQYMYDVDNASSNYFNFPNQEAFRKAVRAAVRSGRLPNVTI